MGDKDQLRGGGFETGLKPHAECILILPPNTVQTYLAYSAKLSQRRDKAKPARTVIIRLQPPNKSVVSSSLFPSSFSSTKLYSFVCSA